MANPFDQFDAPAKANPFDQFDGGTAVAEAPHGTEADRRAAKGRALRGELMAERRSGYGADALMAGAGGAEFVVDAASKMITSIPRAGYAVSEMINPTGRPFVDRPTIEKWTPEMAATVRRAIGGPGSTDISGDETAAGVANAVSDFGEFFTTPEGVATLGAGAAPALARAALGAGFSGQMSSHVPEAFAQAGELSAGDDRAEAVRAGLGALGTAVFAGAIPIGAIAHQSTPRVLPPAERAGKMLEAAVNDPALLDRFEQVANDLAIERSRPELAQRGVVSGQRPAPEMFTAADFNPFDRFDKPPSPPETLPLPTSPALRGEAAMETRPTAEMGLDRTQPSTLNPELSTDLADTIAALRAGYRPAVEKAVEAPAKPIETTTQLVDEPVRAVPAGQIATRADLMQFKRMDEAKSGVNEADKLAGQWDDRKAGVLLLWEPLTAKEHGLAPGQRYIVANGHHRFEFGERAQRKGYNAQVLREADGFSASDARRIAAEVNIADGKGNIYDQAKYFRNTAATLGPDAALAAGRRIGARGRTAADIGIHATDDLFASFVNEQVTPEAARAIANAAPGDEGAQRIGIKFALQGKGADFITNVIKASKAEAGQRAESLDLFGKDDSAMVAMAEQAERASGFQKAIRDRIQVLTAGKKSEAAKSEGIDVRNPEAIPARIAELKAELAQWENWPMQPELVAKVRGEVPKAETPNVQRPTAKAEQFRLASDKGKIGIEHATVPMMWMGEYKDTPANRTKLQKTVEELNSGKTPVPEAMRQAIEQAAPAAPTKPAFSLAPAETVEQQQARLGIEQAGREAKAQQDKLAELQAKPLAGTTGDLGQGDMFAGPQDLFAPPSPKSNLNTGALGESGMGGAKPGEFAGNSGTPTGIKNATVDAERARRGLPPAMEAARRDWGSVWDEAMARVDMDPALQDRLIAELKAKPRALTDTEDALLLHRQIDLQNEYGRATRELAVAYEDSAAFPNRLADVEALKVRTAELSDRLLELYNVNKAAGTETGRGLAARKMMANEDYTLAAMEMEKRAANGGAPLTDAERSAMAKLHERIVDLEAKAVAREEQVATERAGRMTDEAIADMKRELASKPSYDPRIVKIAEEIVTKLEHQADKSRAFLKGKFLSPTPEDIYHLGVIGAAKIARLGLDFGKFSIEMAAEFGDGVKPYLQAAWERANLHLENEGAKYGDKAEPVKRLLRKRDAEGQREGVIEGLKKAQAEGLPVELLGDYVRKLALSFVRGGVTERNALVDAVHKVLTEEIGLELSRRETMDAISGYGRFKPLDMDTAKATLRDLKGQMQQLAKLEDITAKKPLQKTGVERRSQSDEERRLIQQVNEAKRRFGVVVTDPARQLKSALDAVRTRLKHQVADLEYQIATKERIVKSKTDAPFDAETKLLETRRDALRAQLDELVPRPGRTDAQLLELAVRNTERSIADYEQRIAGGEMLVKRAKPGITSPELAALKARRDAVRAEWQELRELDGEFQRQQAEAALTRQKSALEEAIAAKEKALAEGPKPPVGREMSRPADPALESLMQKRDALNRQLAEARKKPWEVKHAEQVARQLAAMEKSIAEREAKLAAGDLSTEARAKVARPLADPELEMARQKLDDVNRRLAEARKPKGTPEERALKALHTRLTTSAAEYADRLARGDFAPRVRKPVPTDPTTLRLKAEAERAKVQWREGLERDRFRQLSPTKKAIEHAKEVLNLPRAVLASWDVSAVLRQGGFITLNPMNWRRAASGLAPMFRALASETRAHMVEKSIRDRPNAPLYDRAKLYLASLDTSKLTAMEELFMSRMSRAIPGVRASERAYITFLNKLRADSFDAMVDRMQAKGTPLTDLELQAVGNFVNVSTGRGDMGARAAAADTLATIFFSPRLVVSRFQLLTGQPLRKAGTLRVARAVAAEYAGFLSGLAVVYALANMAGAEVETDPRSSDFGKLRFGNTRVDPLAGLAQVTGLLSRLGTGETKSISGKVKPIVGDLPYGADTAPDVIFRFLRTKLSPVVGAAVDLRQGENVVGEKVSPTTTLQRMAVPLSFQEIYKVMLEDGVAKGTALGILSLFGWGLQQFDDRKPKK
jgi:hypothetical protein